jgi:hypothetical protein
MNKEKEIALKIEIAKLLLERIFNQEGILSKSTSIGFVWRDSGKIVLDTEWLQIVQWVEEGLTQEQQLKYVSALWTICNGTLPVLGNVRYLIHFTLATVPQRLDALEAAGIIKV